MINCMFNNIKIAHRYLFAQIRRIYFMALPESKQDLKKSRVNFTIGDSAAQTIAQLSGGTFIAALMSYCSISDANIGIITSLLSLAALSQIFLINYFKKLKKYKFLVCYTALHRGLFSIIYFIPLLAIGNGQKAILIVVMYFIGQLFVQIGTPATQDLIASLVPSRLRGKYFSIKDSIAVFVVSSAMLLAGMILDYFKKENLLTGFVIIGLIVLVLVIVNVVALSKMKEPKLSYTNEEGKELHGRLARKAKDFEKNQNFEEQSVASEIKDAFQDRKFRKAFILQSIYVTGLFICNPFNASYQINQLALPYTFIMLIGFIANLYRIYIAPKLGRLADKYGMAKVLKYALFALGLNLLTMAFTVPGNAYPMHVLGSFLSSTAWAFVGIGLFGIQLDFFRPEKRMIWLTILSALSGFMGFVVSIIGGNILDYLQSKDLSLFGSSIYPQQVLNVIGFTIMVFAVLYIKFFIETEKVDVNHKDGRVEL
ncbi:MFS transporter [Anaerocolumna cellulosilytica]|nr:MFS transporter [Anaerocolumna cellulosilytica]MBB5194525.1 MFS family permease [Anaerocolumna cellulosilytica]